MNPIKRLIRFIILWAMPELRPRANGKAPSGPAGDPVWYLPAAFAPGRDDLHPGYPAAMSKVEMPSPWIATTHAEYDALRLRLKV